MVGGVGPERIGYPNLLAAEQVVPTLAKLQAQRMIQLDDAVVEGGGGDKVKLHQAGSGKAGWVGLTVTRSSAPVDDPSIPGLATTSRVT